MFNYNKKIMFYGKQSVLSLTFTVQNQSLQVAIAPAYDPNRTMSRPVPGQKIYNHDNAAFFSIGMSECAILSKNFNDVLAGKYKDPDPKCDPKYTGWIKLTHFKDNQPTKLAMYSTPRDGKITGTAITISISNPGKAIVSYIFKGPEIMIFQSMLEFGWRMLPGICATLFGISSFLKSSKYQEGRKESDNTLSEDTTSSSDTWDDTESPVSTTGNDSWGDTITTETVDNLTFNF
jgi:hypothetical protein